MNSIRLFAFMTLYTVCSSAQSPGGEPYKPFCDFSRETEKHVIIASGTKNIYQGHVTTALLTDGTTMFAVWTVGHGGACGPAAVSEDGGLTWSRIDDRFPKEYKTWRNCPAIYRMTDHHDRERLFVFACSPEHDRRYNRSEGMMRVMSEDGGNTWKVLPELPVTCVMPLCHMLRLKDGSYIAQYNDRWPEQQDRLKKLTNRIFQMRSEDGGLTWSQPRVVAQHDEMNLSEPFLLRSPDGGEICAILRDNWPGDPHSKLMFSRDEGETWSVPVDSSWGLTGHRHDGVLLPDGRWTIAFRDTARNSPSRSHFVAWVGTYDEIKSKAPGKRIKLLHSYAGGDCGYAALEILPDQTICAATYIKYWNDKRKHSLVSVRFNPEDLKE